METKTCTKCGSVFPATVDYFYKTTKNKVGLETQCKECRSQVIKKWQSANKCKTKQYLKKHRIKNKESLNQKALTHYRENKEEINARRRELWGTNKEAKKDYARKWYAANREKMQEWYRGWYQKNKEKARESTRIWVKNNPDKTRIVNQKRQARIKGLPSNLTTEQWSEAINHFNGECAYCGLKTNLTQEHFIPLSRQGDYTTNNIIPACQPCNSSKQDRDFFVWYPKQKFYSKRRQRKILKYLNYHNKAQQTNIYQQMFP